MANKIRVTVWNEYRHEKSEESIRAIYPKGIHGCVKESVCKRCANYRSCIQKGLDESLTKLIEVGAAKSRVSLIDVPQDLSAVCVNQSGLLYDINRRLGDYRKYMLVWRRLQELSCHVLPQPVL